MKIEYNPSEDRLDLAEPSRFYIRYLRALGRGRVSVHLAGPQVLLRADRAGLLSLTARCIDIAIGRIQSHTLEQVEEWESGSWYGDLEPGCTALTISRNGDPVNLPEGFVYEPPPFKRNASPKMESVSRFILEAEGTVGEIYSVILSTDAASLISFAKHFVYLAQPEVPPSENFVYKSSHNQKPKISTLKVEIAIFPQDVPWAKAPKAP